MSEKLHPSPHPDADQLSIFMERADTARERERMLAHLAECQECRDVVFLMQRPVEAPPVAKEGRREWTWQSWLLPAGVAGVALAGLAILLVYWRPFASVPENMRQNAALETPAAPTVRGQGEPLAPTRSPAVIAPPEMAKKGVAPASADGYAPQQEAADAVSSKTPNTESQAAPARAATQPNTTELTRSSVAVMAQAGAAPKPNAPAPSDLNSAAVQQLPVNERNVMNMQPLATPPRPQTAAPQLQAQQNLPAQRVAGQSSGTNPLLAGISGRVSDPSGAVIPDATVALRDASGNAHQITTAADGSFRLAGVPAGRYELTVTAPGFANNKQSIDLKPSEFAMVQPVLNVGSAAEQVTVTASAAPVETEVVESIAGRLPSRLPIASSASLEKRVLSLDTAGTLFLSRNAGKSWKKVHPQWKGKAVRIDFIATQPAQANDKSQDGAAKSAQSVFELTTDAGAVWNSNDGTHWRPE